jgi:hypothetical protein
MADFNPVYQAVLNTSAQPTRGENRAGIPKEWSRAGEMHGVARPAAIPGLAVPGLLAVSSAAVAFPGTRGSRTPSLAQAWGAIRPFSSGPVGPAARIGSARKLFSEPKNRDRRVPGQKLALRIFPLRVRITTQTSCRRPQARQRRWRMRICAAWTAASFVLRASRANPAFLGREVRTWLVVELLTNPFS